jgi:hypothetical protein
VVSLGACCGSASSRAGVDVPVREKQETACDLSGCCLEPCRTDAHQTGATSACTCFCAVNKTRQRKPGPTRACSYRQLNAQCRPLHVHKVSSTSRRSFPLSHASHLRSCSCAALNTCFAHCPGGPAAPAPAPLLLLPPPAPPAAASVSRNRAATCAPAAAGGSWNDSVCCRRKQAAGYKDHVSVQAHQCRRIMLSVYDQALVRPSALVCCMPIIALSCMQPAARHPHGYNPAH